MLRAQLLYRKRENVFHAPDLPPDCEKSSWSLALKDRSGVIITGMLVLAVLSMNMCGMIMAAVRPLFMAGIAMMRMARRQLFSPGLLYGLRPLHRIEPCCFVA